jgi:ABC-type phosphate transport system substrate-binding protein
MTRGPITLAGAALLAFSGLACGRALPEETPATTGPVETGAFEEPATEEGTIEGVGSGAPGAYLRAVGKALEAEDPTVKLRVQDAERDFQALCAGTVDIASAVGAADKDVCGGTDAAVGFHVADAEGGPVAFYVNRDSFAMFEVESLVQYAVDNGETLPAEAGLAPLGIDELQETQTKLEQVGAGVG